MIDRRTFFATGAAITAAAWAVPQILTMEPADAAELHSPPPRPAHETPNESTSGAGDGQLAFTGAPIDQETAVGLAAVAAGAIVWWAARGEHS